MKPSRRVERIRERPRGAGVPADPDGVTDSEFLTPRPVTSEKPKWSPTFPTKTAADEHQREVRTAIANNSFTADRGLTVATFLEEWIARKEAAGKKTSTVVGYKSIIENHLIPNLGRHRLGKLRPDHVQSLIDLLGARPSKRRATPIKAGTLLNVRSCLRAALNDAVRRQLVARNVAVLVELPSVKRPKPISVGNDRLATFLAHVEADPLSALWLTDAVYGMRRGEMLGLRWPDIDEEEHLIRVRQTLVELPGDYECPYCSVVHHRLLFETPKSEAGVRVYPLVPEVAAALMAHRLRQDDERQLFGDDYLDHDLVFAKPDGNPWRPGWISSEFKRHLLASGVITKGERVPPIKALRSSAVTALHEAGAQLEVISKVTGHSGDRVTKDSYLSVTAERTRAEFGAIATRLNRGKKDSK